MPLDNNNNNHAYQYRSIADLVGDSTEIRGPRNQPHSHFEQDNFCGAVGERQPYRMPAQVQDRDAQSERLEQAHRDARYAIINVLGRLHAAEANRSAIRADAIASLTKARNLRLARTTTSTAIGESDGDRIRTPRASKAKRSIGREEGHITPTTTGKEDHRPITPLSPRTRRTRILEFTNAVTRARLEQQEKERKLAAAEAARS